MTRQQFVLELGRAMHALGSPAYRVEDTMVAVSRALGLEGSFFATPTALFAALGAPGEEARTVLLRVPPGDHDLGRLAALYVVRDRVAAGASTPAEGLDALRGVLVATSRHPVALDLSAYALVAAGAALLFGGGGAEAGVAAAAAVLAGGIGRAVRGRPHLEDVQAALTCTATAFVVRAAAALLVPVQPTTTTLAAVIVLLPGLTFTTALAELSMRHLAAGSARLLGAIAVLVTMAIGIGIGDRLGVLSFGEVVPPVRPVLAEVWLVPALLAMGYGFVVLLRALPRHAPFVLLAITAAYGGARLGSALLGSELGAVLGALLVAALGNVYARLWRQPAAVVRTPGLLVLVPGSLGLSGLTTAIAGDFHGGAPLALRMLLVGGAIVAGLLFAGVVVPPPLDVEPEPARGPFRGSPAEGPR